MLNLLKVFALILLTSLTVSSVQAQNRPKLFCAVRSALKHKEYVASFRNDKTKHCTLSCIMALHCTNVSARLVGQLKELADLFGPGDADEDDIKANEEGIRLSHTSENRNDCKLSCLEVYPSR